MNSPDVVAVHKAVMRHSLPEITHAIEQGNDVDALDREGRTALFYAAMDSDSAIATELIRHGANVNVRDKSLKTPLHFAARAYQPKVAELLLKNGAEVDAQDAHGNTPLSDAVFDSKGRDQMIKLLLSSGANKALKNKHGVSAEDLAKSIGNYDISKFFRVIVV
jgi:ankyrin repeat protein